jgi:hypothetical protein
LDVLSREGIKIVVVGQLIASHNRAISSKQSHAWLATHYPLHHFAVGFAGVINEARDAALGGINNHILVKRHEVIALEVIVSPDCKLALDKTHIIVLVVLIHPAIALIFGDNFTGVLNNDLMSGERAIAANTVATIFCLNYFNSNSVFATTSTTFLQIREGTIRAAIATRSTVGIITLVKHDSVLAVLVTPAFRGAYTFRMETVKEREFLPHRSSITYETILMMRLATSRTGPFQVLYRDLLLDVFRHSSGFGCPGGSGEQTSKGSLKSLPTSNSLCPCHIGNGKTEFGREDDEISFDLPFALPYFLDHLAISALSWPA